MALRGLVGVALVAPCSDFLRVGMTPGHQLLHRGDALLARDQQCSGLFHPVSELLGIVLLGGDRLIQALAEAALAMQQFGCPGAAKTRHPTPVELCPVVAELPSEGLGLRHQALSLAQRGGGAVAVGLGALQQGFQQILCAHFECNFHQRYQPSSIRHNWVRL